MFAQHKHMSSVIGSKKPFLSPLNEKNPNASIDKIHNSVGPQLRIEDDQLMTDYSSYHIPTKKRGDKNKTMMRKQNKSPTLLARNSNLSASGFLGQSDPLQTMQQISTIESTNTGANQHTFMTTQSNFRLEPQRSGMLNDHATIVSDVDEFAMLSQPSDAKSVSSTQHLRQFNIHMKTANQFFGQRQSMDIKSKAGMFLKPVQSDSGHTRKRKPIVDKNVIAYEKFLAKKRQKQLNKSVPMRQNTLQRFKSWLQWDEITEPVSEYQKLQESYHDFSQAEIKKLCENSLFKSLTVIQDAIENKDKNIKLYMSQKILKGAHNMERRQLSKKLKDQLLTPAEAKKLPQINVTSSIQTLQEEPNKSSAFFDRNTFLKTYAQEFEDVKPTSRLGSSRSNKSRGALSGRVTPGSRDASIKNVNLEPNTRYRTKSPANVSRNTHVISSTNKSSKIETSSVSTIEVLNKKSISVLKLQRQDTMRKNFIEKVEKHLGEYIRVKKLDKAAQTINKLELGQKKRIFKQTFTETKRVRPEKNQDREFVLQWFTGKLYEILQILNEKQFYPVLDICYMLCLVSKTFRDLNLTYQSYTLMGSVMLHIGFYSEAKQVFEVIKDVALDSHNWSQVMLSYELLGRAYQELQDFENAIFAFKLMLQYSWINYASEFEIKAYEYLSKQNFYLQYVAKAKNYSDRALRGILENVDSCNRRITFETFRSKRISEQKVDKYVRNGYTVERHPNGNKTITCTEDYRAAIQLIENFQSQMQKPAILDDLERSMDTMCTRKVGKKLFRIATPVSKMEPAEVQSPSNDKRDQMILPMVSIADQERMEREDLFENQFSAVAAGYAMKLKKVSTEDAQERVKRRVTNTKDLKKDYLRPLREKREDMERMRGKNNIDWRGIVERAVMLRNLKNKAPTYISHLNNPSVAKDLDKNQSRKEEFKKTKDARQNHISEIESINNTRKVQKEFSRAETASAELTQVALGFLQYLKQMKKCPYEYECSRKGRFNWTQKFVYNGNKNGKPLHEVIADDY